MEKKSVKEIMTVREFARHSGLNECAVRKLLRERSVYSIKVGVDTMFTILKQSNI